METWAIVVVDLISAILGFLSGLFARNVVIKKSKKANTGIITEQKAGNNSIQSVVSGDVSGSINIGKSHNDEVPVVDDRNAL